MNGNPDISVIMPVYNSEDYVKEAVNSVLSQSLKDLELICIDDGSTDGSLKILNQFKDDDRITIIGLQSNYGAGYARNAGLERACGEFIAFLDSDDYYPDTGSLESMLSFSRHDNVSVCGGRRAHVDGDITEMQDLYSKEAVEHPDGTVLHYSDVQSDYHFNNHIFKRSIIEDNGIRFPDYRRFQDPPFFVKAMLCASDFGVVPTVSYCYRISHKEMLWNEENVWGLVNGLRDNLVLARENNLGILYNTTIERLTSDYGNIIYRNRSERIIGILDDMDSLLISRGDIGNCKTILRSLKRRYGFGRRFFSG
jgi:glycosyltransferase involved in cell wall biosynthesis